MLERADRLHRQFFRLEHQQTQFPMWAPPVDIFETEQELIILVALPGVSAKDLVISIDGGSVIVQGQRALPLPRQAAVIRNLEIPYGQFERRIELPPGQFQLGQRMLTDGCLVMTLNKLG